MKLKVEEGKKKSRSPRKRKPYPKKAEGGLDVAGSEHKYKEAHDNKYAPKEKIGTPTLGREKAYVTRVGLGNLETITYVNTNVQP